MKESRLAITGAVIAGIGASLCCIGPVLFAGFGLGAFGAASLFVAARPYLLASAVLLLAFGFYWTYFRKQRACVPGEACETKRINRLGRAALWIASAAVLAFALSPYYVGHVASALSRASADLTTEPVTTQSSTASHPLETVTVKVDGMSCSACEVPIRDVLTRTPGVRAADVSYERGDAQVKYDPKQTDAHQIKRAIDSTGYKAK